MLSKIITTSIIGIEAVTVNLETDISRGLPVIKVVGLGDKAVNEATSRVRTAIASLPNMLYPMGRITINLSPAWLPKRGSHFDLAMAIGILASSKQIDTRLIEYSGFIGELSLDGNINECNGMLPMVIAMKKSGIKYAFVPLRNEEEASMVEGIDVIGVSSLHDVINVLNSKNAILKRGHRIKSNKRKEDSGLDYFDIKGQEEAKRAILIASAGMHSILMKGSPGSGKTMLAERIPSILGDLSQEDMMTLTSIYSVSGMLDSRDGIMHKRPFREVSKGITEVGMIGGGYPPKPGEMTLAHKGVLFVDELIEHSRNVIESMRIPLEKKKIILKKYGKTYVFPADFVLVGAMNPCKCGYYGDKRNECTCTAYEISSYQSKLSSAISDRIDIHISLSAPLYDDLKLKHAQTSAQMKKKIQIARAMQTERYRFEQYDFNSSLDAEGIIKYCTMNKECDELLGEAYDGLSLNPRLLGRIKKVARTIADLEGKEIISVEHISEAIQYRERRV